jgi:DNA-binding transcriptional LysR family regulator
MEATKMMVEEGLGLALVPRIAVDRELGIGILREIEIAGTPNPTRQIALINRRSRPLGPVAQAFVDIVQEIYVTGRGQNSGVPAVAAGAN